jgi:hypothetical protein
MQHATNRQRGIEKLLNSFMLIIIVINIIIFLNLNFIIIEIKILFNKLVIYCVYKKDLLEV